MKLLYKNYVLVVLALLAVNVCAMDIYSLPRLPIEIKKKIVLDTASTAKSLIDAVQKIKTLAFKDTELDIAINEPEFCLEMIKILSRTFVCSDEKVALTLDTKGSKERMDLQDELRMLIVGKGSYTRFKDCRIKTFSLEKFETLCERGGDLEFVYSDEYHEKNTITLLCLVIREWADPVMVKAFIDKKVNLNQEIRIVNICRNISNIFSPFSIVGTEIWNRTKIGNRDANVDNLIKVHNMLLKAGCR